MSVVDEINRIKTNIANAYTSLGEKGATLPAVLNSANLASVVATVPTGGGTISLPEKDVNFYDYDGTVVASYTASDFANLTELPANPSHDGLTAQGWNWTLADAQTYVADYGKLNIGQTYITDDGKTRIYIHLEEGRLKPTLGFATNGTVTIDWGDGSTQDVTGTSTSTTIYTQHIYLSGGDYVITLKLLDDTKKIYIIGASQGTNLILKSSSENAVTSRVYNNAIKKIELGSNISFNNYAFNQCQGLETITIPESTGGTNAAYMFQYCYSLKIVIFPINAANSISTYAFRDCHTLKIISLPKRMAVFGTYAFQNCYILKDIQISTNVSSLADNLFANCYSFTKLMLPKSISNFSAYAVVNNCTGIKYLDFSKHTSIPTTTLGAFNGLASDYQIVVPDDLYEDWKATTGWSSNAVVGHIVKASEV